MKLFIHGEKGYMVFFFGSIYKKVMKLFIHPREGYGVTFKPKVMSGIQLKDAGYRN
jgi:hypothetical protein